jgi:transcription antitermination factor NusG
MNQKTATAPAPKVEGALGWYVICTKSKQERVARLRLQDQGYEVYLPLRLVEYKRGEIGATPLFPRHLFVRQSPRWRSIFSTIGVRSVYCIGDNPAVLPQVAIDLFKAHEIDGRIRILPEAPRPIDRSCPFTKDQRVKVKDGPMVGLEGVFHERVDANRVAILLKGLGRETRVELELDHLR